MRGASGLLAIAVATLLVACSADPHPDQDISASEHTSGDRYDANEYRQQEELNNFLRFLTQYENAYGTRNGLGGLGGSSLLGRNSNGIGGSTLLGRNVNGLGGSSLLGREVYPGLVPNRNNLNGLGGSSLLGRDTVGDKRYSRFIDSLGGGNFVRNLDSIGGGNFVKKNLDQLGGPNLVKRNLDSLGGGNFVRQLDSLGGGNFVRQLDSIGGGQKTRNLDPLGGGNLIREVRDIRRSGSIPYFMARALNYASPYGGKRENAWPMMPAEYGGYYGDGFPKRNFDEIDRSGLDTFVRKRNFDEIDRSSMSFPYATKRFYHLYGTNYIDLETPASSFDKKRYRPDYPMDEIDLSHFPIGSKRSQDFPLAPHAL